MADRRSARSALERYGDRLDKSDTAAHYQAEATEATAALMALRAEWDDGYRAGYTAACRTAGSLYEMGPSSLALWAAECAAADTITVPPIVSGGYCDDPRCNGEPHIGCLDPIES